VSNGLGLSVQSRNIFKPLRRLRFAIVLSATFPLFGLRLDPVFAVERNTRAGSSHMAKQVVIKIEQEPENAHLQYRAEVFILCCGLRLAASNSLPASRVEFLINVDRKAISALYTRPGADPRLASNLHELYTGAEVKGKLQAVEYERGVKVRELSKDVYEDKKPANKVQDRYSSDPPLPLQSFGQALSSLVGAIYGPTALLRAARTGLDDNELPGERKISPLYDIDPIQAAFDGLAEIGDSSMVPGVLSAIQDAVDNSKRLYLDSHMGKKYMTASAAALDKLNPSWRDGPAGQKVAEHMRVFFANQ
jgi:hypothetical protein